MMSFSEWLFSHPSIQEKGHDDPVFKFSKSFRLYREWPVDMASEEDLINFIKSLESEHEKQLLFVAKISWSDYIEYTKTS